jgi:hypothetical protein
MAVTKSTYEIPNEERIRSAYRQGEEEVVKVFQEILGVIVKLLARVTELE